MSGFHVTIYKYTCLSLCGGKFGKLKEKSKEFSLKISLNNISEVCVSVKTLTVNISAIVCCRYNRFV
jgi:hypothetical protein